MKPKRSPRNESIDGFVPRQQRRTSMDDIESHETTLSAVDETPAAPESMRHVGRSDIRDSLNSIEDEPVTEPKKRRLKLFGRKRKQPIQRTKFQKWRKRIIIIVMLLLVLIAGYFGYRVLSSMLKLTHGNLISLVQPGTPLKTDDQGRTNILVFGTSQDDAAHQNAEGGGGLWLTDSIMLVSMNQKKHTVKTVSLPRDLWMKMPNSCEVGNYAKINASYECAAGFVYADASEQQKPDYAENDKAGAKALQNSVEQATGITPQYFVHVNYSVLQQAVDAVGGVDVDIKGHGANGLYDSNFDWDCNGGKPHSCKNVYYENDGTYPLDGRHALFLSRARGEGPGSYGLDGGDYDRQANQQKILAALKTKALSAGTLANPFKLTDLLDALGDNVTTDLEAGNYKTLIDFVNKMPKDGGMESVSLVKEGEAVVQGSMYNGQSIQTATSGLLDYSSIIAYVGRNLSTNPAVSENASIAVYNASGLAGKAGDVRDTLTAGGLADITTANADNTLGTGGKYVIYDTSGGKKPETLKYIQSKLSDSKVSSSPVPAQLAGSADIIVVIGS